MTDWPLENTPFYFIGPRRYREAEVAAYIRREHRRGRPLAEILNDPYFDRRCGEGLLRAVLQSPTLIRALGQDVVEAIRLQGSELPGAGGKVASALAVDEGDRHSAA
jgi:hypothetical protein